MFFIILLKKTLDKHNSIYFCSTEQAREPEALHGVMVSRGLAPEADAGHHDHQDVPQVGHRQARVEDAASARGDH